MDNFFDKMPSKQSFILGLVSGFLALCTIGFFIMLVMMLSGKVGKLVSAGNVNQANVNQAAQVQPNDTGNQPSASDLAKNLKPITDADHIRGNKNAPVVMVEFSDFQCPFCSSVYPTLEKIMADYPGKVAWVYRHLPLDQLHPYARNAAEASECAAEQGKFWQFADDIYNNQDKLSLDYPTSVAKNLGLDMTQFNSCLSSHKYASRVQDNEEEATAAGVQGTPGIYVNNVLIKGALPYSNFKQVVDSFLK